MLNIPSVDHAFSVTPSNTVDLAQISVVYVGTKGNLKVLPAMGSAVTFTAVNSGTLLPFKIKRVFASGTTCTNIVGGY